MFFYALSQCCRALLRPLTKAARFGSVSLMGEAIHIPQQFIVKLNGIWEANCLPKLHKCRRIITGMFTQNVKGKIFSSVIPGCLWLHFCCWKPDLFKRALIPLMWIVSQPPEKAVKEEHIRTWTENESHLCSARRNGQDERTTSFHQIFFHGGRFHFGSMRRNQQI